MVVEWRGRVQRIVVRSRAWLTPIAVNQISSRAISDSSSHSPSQARAIALAHLDSRPRRTFRVSPSHRSHSGGWLPAPHASELRRRGQPTGGSTEWAATSQGGAGSASPCLERSYGSACSSRLGWCSPSCFAAGQRRALSHSDAGIHNVALQARLSWRRPTGAPCAHHGEPSRSGISTRSVGTGDPDHRRNVVGASPASMHRSWTSGASLTRWPGCVRDTGDGPLRSDRRTCRVGGSLRRGDLEGAGRSDRRMWTRGPWWGTDWVGFRRWVRTTDA